MLAVSPTCFSAFGCPTDPIIHDLNFNFGDHTDQTAESILNFPPIDNNYNNFTPNQLQQEIGVDYNSAFSGDMVKKLNHNASERHRRKKINTLYSSLRSLLPAADQMQKKLSIPTTVSRVVKYIPELQHQVERLTQKKEELLSKIASPDDMSSNNIHQDHRRELGSMNSSSFLVSTNRLSDREVVVQISTTHKAVHKCPLLSEILLKLEEDGLVLMNSSSFESGESRVSHNLHLQAKEGSDARLQFEALSEKLVSLYGKRNP